MPGVFEDPNFLQLLAGFGAGLDPKGVGGALGRSAMAYGGAVASQKRADTQDEVQNAQVKLLLDALAQHGMPTPKEQPGLNNATLTPDGVKLDISTAQPLQGQGGGGSEVSSPTPVSTTPSVGTDATSSTATSSPFSAPLPSLAQPASVGGGDLGRRTALIRALLPLLLGPR